MNIWDQIKKNKEVSIILLSLFTLKTTYSLDVDLVNAEIQDRKEKDIEKNELKLQNPPFDPLASNTNIIPNSLRSIDPRSMVASTTSIIDDTAHAFYCSIQRLIGGRCGSRVETETITITEEPTPTPAPQTTTSQPRQQTTPTEPSRPVSTPEPVTRPEPTPEPEPAPRPQTQQPTTQTTTTVVQGITSSQLEQRLQQFRESLNLDNLASITIVNQSNDVDVSNFVTRNHLARQVDSINNSIRNRFSNLFSTSQTFDGNLTFNGENIHNNTSTFNGSSIFNNNITLNSGLIDSNGNLGDAGQFLQSTGTATEWVNLTMPSGSNWTQDGNDIFYDSGNVRVEGDFSTITSDGTQFNISDNGFELFPADSGTKFTISRSGHTINALSSWNRAGWFMNRGGATSIYASSVGNIGLNLDSHSSIFLNAPTVIDGDLTFSNGGTINEVSEIIGNGGITFRNGGSGATTFRFGTSDAANTVRLTFGNSSGSFRNLSSGFEFQPTVSNVTIGSTQSSTSPANGALRVSGGLGVGENVNVGGNLSLNGGLFDSNGNLGTAGQVLTTTGTEVEWGTVSGGGSPAGSDGDVQLNIGGSFATLDGFNLDITGNARGNNALDIQSSRWSNTQVASGNSAVAIGLNNTASGNYSLVFGSNNTASGNRSSASGNYSCASGWNSTASGYSNTASGYNSTALGARNNASGDSSTASGYSNWACGSFSLATGGYNTATEIFSSAVGSCNVATGRRSSALGFQNTATGYYSFAEETSAIGYCNMASGNRSSALGHRNNASGGNSSSFGNSNCASEGNSSSFGNYNSASGCYSSAFGSGAWSLRNTASGERSSAFGFQNEACNTRSSAFGNNISHNIADAAAIGSSNTARLMLCCTGANSAEYHFANLPTGSLSSAGGVLTSSSDERLKNINNIGFSRGLSDLQNIQPISYTWKSENMNVGRPYIGFSAQNIRESIPEAVFENNDGYLSLSDRPILAASINAIKELNVRTNKNTESATKLDDTLTIANATIQSNAQNILTLQNLTNENTEQITINTENISSIQDLINEKQNKILSLRTDLDELTDQVTENISSIAKLKERVDNLFNTIESLGATVVNGVLNIGEVFVSRLRSDEIQTDKICIGDTCLTEEDFKELIENRTESSAADSNTSVSDNQSPQSSPQNNSADETEEEMENNEDMENDNNDNEFDEEDNELDSEDIIEDDEIEEVNDDSNIEEEDSLESENEPDIVNDPEPEAEPEPESTDEDES